MWGYPQGPVVFGHSFALTPRAAETLRQTPSVSYKDLYADIAFGRVPGFICTRCGIGFDEYIEAVALLAVEKGSTSLSWSSPQLIDCALHVGCEPRAAIIKAALQGRSGEVLFNALVRAREHPVYHVAREAIGIALDRSFVYFGLTEPPRLHR